MIEYHLVYAGLGFRDTLPPSQEALMNFCLTAIAYMHSDFPTKFGIPRQSGLVDDLTAQVIFTPPYRNPDALRGLEEFSHIWLIWGFSETAAEGWRPTVRPPRLGGNRRTGVFATRSPFRPNALGLSCVRLREIRQTRDGSVLVVTGADLMDGTPIYDIKPYLPYADAHPEASGGFTSRHAWTPLAVTCPPALWERVPPDKREGLMGALAQDPRPSYHDDPRRLYGMSFAGLEVRFTVSEGRLTVQDVVPSDARGGIRH